MQDFVLLKSSVKTDFIVHLIWDFIVISQYET